MSAEAPTIEEIKYLSALDLVRTGGFDYTSPALARLVIKQNALLYKLRAFLRSPGGYPSNNPREHELWGILREFDQFLESKSNSEIDRQPRNRQTPE